jgi:hypothetical protein
MTRMQPSDGWPPGDLRIKASRLRRDGVKPEGAKPRYSCILPPRRTKSSPKQSKALHTLDGYKRRVVNSLAANLQRSGFERVSKSEPLQESLRKWVRLEAGQNATNTLDVQSRSFSLRSVLTRLCALPPKITLTGAAGGF